MILQTVQPATTGQADTSPACPTGRILLICPDRSASQHWLARARRFNTNAISVTPGTAAGSFSALQLGDVVVFHGVKTCETSMLIDRLRRHHPTIPIIIAGITATPTEVADLLAGGAAGVVLPTRQPRVSPPAGVTPRLIDILRLIADGRTYKQIGANLNIAPDTVKSHLARLSRLLEVNDASQLVLAGLRGGWL